METPQDRPPLTYCLGCGGAPAWGVERDGRVMCERCGGFLGRRKVGVAVDEKEEARRKRVAEFVKRRKGSA